MCHACTEPYSSCISCDTFMGETSVLPGCNHFENTFYYNPTGCFYKACLCYGLLFCKETDTAALLLQTNVIIEILLTRSGVLRWNFSATICYG